MMKIPPWTGGTEEEYQTQHFGFGAQRLKISVRQMVEQKIRKCVKDMETYLQDSLDLNDKDKTTLTHSCDKLIRLYCERAGPSLDNIDEEIERVLRIPPNVLLPEDEVQLEQVSDEEYCKLREEVDSLRKRVERAALMEALLSTEEEELSLVDKVCEIAKKDMEVLDLMQKDLESSDSVKTMLSDVQFLRASVPFINKNNEDNLFEE